MIPDDNRAGPSGPQSDRVLDRPAFIAAAVNALEGRGAWGGSMYVIDLDHFADLIDRFGSDVAEEILERLSPQIAMELRSGELVAHWGGDRFVVFAPGTTDPAAVTEMAERLLARCGEVVTSQGTLVVLGASIGVATTTGGEIPAVALIRRADAAMERAKVEGRGRFVVSALGPGDAHAEVRFHARAALDSVGRSIMRAEQRLFTLWRSALRLGDDRLPAELVESSHVLRTAARYLGRAALRFDPDHLAGAFTPTPTPMIGDPRPTGTAPGWGSSAAMGGVRMENDAQRTIVRVWGEHDRSNTKVLEEALHEVAMVADGDIVVDLSAATFVDGSTMRVLTDARNDLSGGSSLKVRPVTPHQERILGAAGLGELIDTAPLPDDVPPPPPQVASALASWVPVPTLPRDDLQPPGVPNDRATSALTTPGQDPHDSLLPLRDDPGEHGGA